MDLLSRPQGSHRATQFNDGAGDTEMGAPGVTSPRPASSSSSAQGYQWIPRVDLNSPISHRGSNWTSERGSPSMVSDFSTHQSHSGSTLAISRATSTGEAALPVLRPTADATFGPPSSASDSSTKRGLQSLYSGPSSSVSPLNMEVRVSFTCMHAAA